jgi:hypothetical protein
VIEPEVGEPDLADGRVLQQVIRARGALQASAEDEHSHQDDFSVAVVSVHSHGI